jgi:hypothetical protein
VDFTAFLDQMKQNNEQARILQGVIDRDAKELQQFLLAQADELSSGQRMELDLIRRNMLEGV